MLTSIQLDVFHQEFFGRFVKMPPDFVLFSGWRQVANVKKETKFTWYKEDEEIVLETAPNAMSGSVALPIPQVTGILYHSFSLPSLYHYVSMSLCVVL